MSAIHRYPTEANGHSIFFKVRDMKLGRRTIRLSLSPEGLLISLSPADPNAPMQNEFLSYQAHPEIRFLCEFGVWDLDEIQCWVKHITQKDSDND